ncbi:MAG: CotS family spore coat protein [Peptococcaceae bacterium]
MDQSIIKDYVADASTVLKQYPIQALFIKKYQYKSKKAVWFVKTNQANYALKRYWLDDKQWNTIISAYNYLSKEVNNVAPLLSTKDANLWTKYKDNYYILTNWVKGSTPDYTNNEDLTKLTRGIAELHTAARNYPAADMENADKYLGRWPLDTRRKQGLLLEYKYEAENIGTHSFAKLYLKHYQSFFEIYEEVAEVFEHQIYQQWVKKTKEYPCLCVNGFSPHNFSLGEKNILWLLHLDNICLDLPARDIRKLILKTMYIKEKWCPETFALIMKNYLNIFPLAKDELKVLLAELKSPHLFFNVTTNFFLNQKANREADYYKTHLIKTLKFEQGKLDILSRFWQLL